jgi:hypothetical protein
MRDAVWLIGLAIVFLISHVPLEYRTGAGQDEDWYAIPGSMILRGGLPRIPYAPGRDPSSAAYMADEVLYALPPFHFYVQALTQLFLGDGVGPARMASTLVGLAAVYCVYALARIWFSERRVAIFAATAFILSRAYLFPAIMARPDMTAASCGLYGLLFVVRYGRCPSNRLLALSGVACGLSLLSHPFGSVPSVQVGLTLLAQRGSVGKRLRDAAVFSLVALLVFSLWLPLIALHPDWFRGQFSANVLSRAGPGLLTTLLSPQTNLWYQAVHFWEFVLPLPGTVYVLALVWAIVRMRFRHVDREFLTHCLGSLLLMAVLQGRHPAIGYYVYPVALVSIAVGLLASDLAILLEGRSIPRPAWRVGAATFLVTCLLAGVFLPGAGLRTLWAHARHASDPNYNAHSLSQTIMADVPESGLIAVDCAYVVDFYLAGRPVIGISIHKLTYDVRDHPFEYAVFGRQSLTHFKPYFEDLVFVKAYGDKQDLFAEYAELYRREPPRKK